MRKPILCAALASTLVWAQASARTPRKVTGAEVQKVHRSALLIDLHNDITSFTVEGGDIGQPTTERHTDIPRMKQGGMGAQFFAVFVSGNYAKENMAAHRTIDMIDTVKHDIVERYPQDFAFATTADDILRARKQGKMAALMGIEGGHAIEDDLRILRQFYNLGIRYMTLTHSNNNTWAGSSMDLSEPNKGLTDLGRKVVQEMNRLGMMVDISHTSDKTFYDSLEVSRAPLIASHSSCRALSSHPRNMTDEMIIALGKRKGVVHINFSCDYLSQEYFDASKKLPPMQDKAAALREQYKNDPQKMREEFRKLMASRKGLIPPATLADVVAHINHVVKLAGIDAVGLGSDFDGVACVPTGLATVAEWPNLTRALLEQGYSAADIRKIYGANTLRVMRDTERVARELQRSAAVR